MVGKMINRLFPAGTRRRAALHNLLYRSEAPAWLRRNHRVLPAGGEKRLTRSLTDRYFTDPTYYPDPPSEYLATPEGASDMAAHLRDRLQMFRSSVVPWLDSAMPLRGSRVLEIGCGTGASTVALVEQGAQVVGVDVSEGALAVAQERCRLYGLEASFVCANAARLPTGMEFDCVIFFAVLEHMTWTERLAALSTAWRGLAPGCFLVVIETPNRLWHTDDHTSDEPFFNWISDEVALAYSGFTRRPVYNRAFCGAPFTEETRLLFSRWGRGVSFHDFAIAFSELPHNLPVVSCLTLYRRRRVAELLRPGTAKFEKILQRLAPEVHRAFFCRYLDLVFRKP